MNLFGELLRVINTNYLLLQLLLQNYLQTDVPIAKIEIIKLSWPLMPSFCWRIGFYFNHFYTGLQSLSEDSVKVISLPMRGGILTASYLNFIVFKFSF